MVTFAVLRIAVVVLLVAANAFFVAAEFALVILGMLMFSERTWKHHCVTLMLPFAVLVYYLARAAGPRWLRGGLAGSLVVVLGLMLVTGLAAGRDRASVALAPGLAKLTLRSARVLDSDRGCMSNGSVRIVPAGDSSRSSIPFAP